MSIIKLLSKKIERTLFTTPSHNQKPIFSKEYADFYKDDFSELQGFDNLSNPKSSIFFTQGKVSDILNSKQTFFITQGATCAILSAMKAIIKPADKVLVARNCHKSVFSGLILCAGIVDWFMPETDSEWGIYTYIDPDKLEKTLEINDYKVFIMTCPTYEGIISDIEKIADICKKHNTYLIVDEAHGSLYSFSDLLPKSALEQGADITVNSLHKTAGALNQCALLNVSKNIKNFEIETFQKAVNLFHTTSPSYPLLANIEACVNYMNSKECKNNIKNLINEIEKAKNELKRYGVEFYEKDYHDPTKILIKKDGITGFDLSDSLFEEFKIEDEMANQLACLYLTGIGTTKQKLEKLKYALKKVQTNQSFVPDYKIEFQPHPLVKIQPVDTFGREFSYVAQEEALLKISNQMILPYPPGIALLYPGEAIQKWHLDYLNNDVEVIQ